MLKRTSYLVITIAMLISMLSISPTSSQAATLNYNIGFSQGNEISLTTTSDARINQILDDIVATGAGYVRIDFIWGLIETSKDTFNWTHMDKVVNACNQRNLEIIALPTSSAGWSGPGWNYPPYNGEDYRSFCYQIAKRYIPQGVTVYELWNEANIQNMTAEVYTSRVLIPGSNGDRQAANESGQQVTVLSTGMASAGETGKTPTDYLNGIYANGGKNYFDAVANHPYNWSATPGNPYDVENPLLSTDYFMKQQDLYNIMVANGDGHKKIWVTEYGMPTCPSGVNVWNSIQEVDQGNYIVDSFNQWKQWSWAGPFNLHWLLHVSLGSAISTCT